MNQQVVFLCLQVDLFVDVQVFWKQCFVCFVGDEFDIGYEVYFVYVVDDGQVVEVLQVFFEVVVDFVGVGE